ncbi:hypothetical protein [Streptomonospora alba]|uniref:hypothetical protein n=1 Tax=Streptomonospora alba TaxID=183763 RepID=UPI00187DD760|nr:hypothetical protein [Streptomonospora alba]
MSSDPVQYGEVKSSYFWDDGSGINGDTGAPASGEPMQKGMAASPSWPLGTEGYVEYNGKKAEFFIGDRGPGHPAENCDVLLDLDGKTFAELTGGSWNDSSYTVSGGQGHIDVEYYITEWGDGAGTAGAPQPMSGSEVCDGKAVQPVPASAKDDGDEKKKQESDSDEGSSDEGSSDEGSSEESGDDGGSGEKTANDAQDSGGEDSTEQQQSGAASGDGGDDGSGKGLTAESASNDISGISLAGNDLPLAAGVLTLAIVPALLVALLFARRKPAADYAGSGRHRSSSPLSAEGLRETAQSVRATAVSYWERASRSVRRDSGGTGRE